MKQNGFWKRGLPLLLAVSVCLGATGKEASASSLTNDLIEESEGKIDEAQTQKNSLATGMEEINKILKSLEEVKGDLQAYVKQLDASLAELTNKIDLLNDAIEEKEEDIEETQQELSEAKETEERQYQAMKKRIRFMYERGQSSYMELLFDAGNFADFLNKAAFIKQVSDYDRNMLKEYVAAKEAIEEKEEELLKEQEELNEVKAALAKEEQNVSTLIGAKKKEIKVYEADISNKEQLVREYEAEIAAQDAVIKELEQTIAAEKKRLIEANAEVTRYDGGQFAFPAPNYKRISDEYGWRIHPTLGVEQFHNGVDLAAPSGSPILAAYDGKVIASAYSGTMGNYIMLDHGDGLITIYMHASALLVSEGATVVKGEKIALVGSTGRSTGPHLHFSVRLNGSYVSPWNYIK